MALQSDVTWEACTRGSEARTRRSHHERTNSEQMGRWMTASGRLTRRQLDPMARVHTKQPHGARRGHECHMSGRATRQPNRAGGSGLIHPIPHHSTAKAVQ